MLSNLVLRDFDALAHNEAASRDIAYTRYADDLIFSSGSSSFNREAALELIGIVFKHLLRYGLRPHTSKISISPPGARKVVLGMLVDTQHPRLTKEFRNKISKHLHALIKYGPVNHAQTCGFRSILAMKLHIAGLINYAYQVDQELGKELKAKYRLVDWSGSSVLP